MPDRVTRAFAGKTAIVTGAASGIGLRLAAQLVAAGTHVVAVDVDADKLRHAVGQITPSTGSIRSLTLDVTDRAAFEAAVNEAASSKGIDFLFNNAGISAGGRTHQMPVAQWERVVDVNLWGVVNGVLAAYPRMVEQGHGHIVNTASAAGLAPPPFVTAYAMTKHAVVGLSTGLRAEAALHGVRVSVLCPGPIDTPILDQHPPGHLHHQPTASITAREYLSLIGQRPVSADGFAARVLAQVARNRAVIVAPTRTRVLSCLQRLSPRAMRAISSTLARKVDAALDSSERAATQVTPAGAGGS